MNTGPQYHGKRELVVARHAVVFEAVRSGGLITFEQAWAVARKACGATRAETKCSIDRLLLIKKIEVVEKGNRSGKVSTYRVKEERANGL